jgi:hypothetical protein
VVGENAGDSTSSLEKSDYSTHGEITKGLVKSLRTHIRDLATSTGKSLRQTIVALTDVSHPITLTVLSAQSELSAIGHAHAMGRVADEIVARVAFKYVIRPAGTEQPVETTSSRGVGHHTD